MQQVYQQQLLHQQQQYQQLQAMAASQVGHIDSIFMVILFLMGGRQKPNRKMRLVFLAETTDKSISNCEA